MIDRDEYQHSIMYNKKNIFDSPRHLHAHTEHNRAEVARGSIGAVVHVAKLMADDPVLVCAVSAAVYNFVSRQGGSTRVPLRLFSSLLGV